MELTKKYNALIRKHCHENIEFLSECGINFCLLCRLSEVSFNPPLPSDVTSRFEELIVFVLAGYTLNSLEIYQNNVEFEAGFGNQNIGSFVSVSLDGILQIFIKDVEGNDLVLFNRYENIAFNNQEVFINQDESNDEKNDEINQKNFNDSLNAILSNPQNKKIIKEAQKNKNK